MRIMLLSFLFLLFSATVYAEVPERPSINTHVYDYAGVIDDEVEEEMRALIQQIEAETSNQIVLMTIDTIGDMEAFEFGNQVIRQWGIGQKDANNGMLIYTTTAQGAGNNDIWISVGQGLGGQFPDGKLGRMIDTYMMESLKTGDFTAAFLNVLMIIKSEMLGEIENADPEELSDSEGGFIYEVLAFILLFLGVGGFLLFILVSLFGGSDDDDSSSSGNNSSNNNHDDSSSSPDYSSSPSDYGSFGGGDSDGGGSGRSF